MISSELLPSSAFTRRFPRACLWALVLGLSIGLGHADVLDLRDAGSTEMALVNGEAVITSTNAVFVYVDSGESEIVTRANRARWWREQGKISMRGSVQVERDDQVLTCDRMNAFFKGDRHIDAQGNFVFWDSTDQVELTGDRGHYDLEREFFTLYGEPRFVRYDTAAAETLIITSERMTYGDSLQIAAAHDSVRILRGPLTATCQQGRYYTKRDFAELRGQPFISYSDHTIEGDSVDLFFDNDALHGVSVTRNAHGRYRQDEGADTTTTHIWGDSVYMQLVGDGSIDSIRVFRDVRSTYYLSSQSDTANEVSGKTMVLAFGREGELENATVWGNARSTYYVVEENGRGRNEATGDSIKVFFVEGRASELLMSGSVRGVYFPQLEPATTGSETRE